MDYLAIIMAAAKKVGVAGQLLFAVCSYESANFTDIYVHKDGGSPSYGICMVKHETAKMMGFKGTAEQLMKNHRTNAYYAAKYLKYQMNRYKTDDWCIITAAYNAGSFNESTKSPGYPMNLKYVRRVQKRLEDPLKHRLKCGVTP